MKRLKSPKSKGKSLKKVKSFLSSQKQGLKNLGQKRGNTSSESDYQDTTTTTVGSKRRSKVANPAQTQKGRKNGGGVRNNLTGILLGLVLISGTSGLLLIPILHSLGQKYLWVSFGGSSFVVVLSFLGIAASTALLLALYVVIFALGDIRNKSLDGNILVISFGISVVVAIIPLLVAALQFHDVVEIFGKEFLELLQGYWLNLRLKCTMDKIQIEFQCCGFYSYEDWEQVEGPGNYPKKSVPFSCCSLNTLRRCHHDKLPNVEELPLKTKSLEDGLSIYTRGCKGPMEDYYRSMLYWVIILTSFLFVTQLLLTLLIALSRKSNSSATVL